MRFEWISKRPPKGKAMITKSHVLLDKNASAHFAHAYAALLGWDKDKSTLAIKPISKQEYYRGTIPEHKRHRLRLFLGRARVKNRRFVTEALETHNLKERLPLTFPTEWNPEKKTVIINLKNFEEA